MRDHHAHNTSGDADDPSAAATWIIGFMSVALFVFTFFALHGVERVAGRAEVERKQLTVEPQELEDLVEAQEARINRAPHWERLVVDGQEMDRYLVIPIEDAMFIVASEAGTPCPEISATSRTKASSTRA